MSWARKLSFWGVARSHPRAARAGKETRLAARFPRHSKWSACTLHTRGCTWAVLNITRWVEHDSSPIQTPSVDPDSFRFAYRIKFRTFLQLTWWKKVVASTDVDSSSPTLTFMWSSFKTVNSEIDLFTVYDAILAGGQTRKKLQWMYGILAQLKNRCNAHTNRRISNICHYLKYFYWYHSFNRKYDY